MFECVPTTGLVRNMTRPALRAHRAVHRVSQPQFRRLSRRDRTVIQPDLR
jgi:hypothetical protein